MTDADTRCAQLEPRADRLGSMRIEAKGPSSVPDYRSKATSSSSFRSVSLGSPARLNATEARALLSDAWSVVIGNSPEPRTSALLTAHWALETDAGRCMPGHNFAGIKATPAALGKEFRTVEGHGATRHEISARFRVYESAEAGALDYVRLLATRYPDAIRAARAGDSAGFSRALAQGGYFTASPEAYAAGLEWRLSALDQGHLGDALAAPAAAAGTLVRAALDGLLHALRAQPDDG